MNAVAAKGGECLPHCMTLREALVDGDGVIRVGGEGDQLRYIYMGWW